MKPMISPWTIYFASRADAVGTLFLIVAVAAFAICLIGFDDLTKNGFKLFISIGIISVILTVLTPTTETVYTMMVANELTSDNVQAIGKTGKDVIDYITDQIDKGYKVLDPHIGIIYGDGCTLNNVKQVWEKLKKKGFAANNIVFGVGAFCFSAVIEPDGHMVVVTRDMFGIAMKATYGIVNGEPIMIYKDPKTDTSHLKKSHKGCCCIYHDDNGELQCMDGFNDVFRDGVLRTVFKDGEMYHKETFEDIRERLNGGNKDE